MNTNRLIGAAAAMVLAGGLCGTASAAGFTNGDFESGTLAGWQLGGGSWYGGAYPQPQNYYPGSGPVTITNAGFDPLTDNHLRTVYAGAHSVQVNDSYNDYSVSTIRQQVNGYTDPVIAFAYAAVLQESHGPSDSDAFIITLQDLTTNTTLFTTNVNSATAPGLFTYSRSGWYYTDWQTVSIDVSGLQGHDFMLSLLANDCPYGGHAGYAYLDGFGGIIPTPGGGVPEPSTWALMLAGFGLAGAALRHRRAQALAA